MKKKTHKGGRPKEIDGEAKRVCYYLKIEQARYIEKKAKTQRVSESEIMRAYIDNLIRQESPNIKGERNESEGT